MEIMNILVCDQLSETIFSECLVKIKCCVNLLKERCGFLHYYILSNYRRK